MYPDGSEGYPRQAYSPQTPKGLPGVLRHRDRDRDRDEIHEVI